LSYKVFCLNIAILATVTGCGMTPMLKSPDDTAAQVDYTKSKVKVNVVGIEGYLNHKFHQELMHHLSLTRIEKPLTVDVTITQTYPYISFGADAVATRSQNILVASYEISHGGKKLKKGKVDSVSSYNVDQNDEFSTLTSRMGSDDKVLTALAEEVAREVYLAIQ